MRLRDGAALLSLAVLGGASFLFIRVAAPELGPFVLMETRVLIAGLVLMIAATMSGQVIAFGEYWRRYLILGALYGAIPYALIAIAALHIPASMAAVLNATTPLFTAVVAVFSLGEALSVRKLGGLLLGLTGVALVVGWTPRSVDGSVLPWTLCMLLSSLFYALGSTYAKKALQGVPAIAVATGQQLGAAILLLPAALATWPSSAPSGRAVTALLLLALLATALTSHLFFGLVAKIGPTRTVSVLFLVPLVGIVLGHLFLAEPIGLSLLIGLGVILVGVFLLIGGSVNRKEFVNLPKNERKNAAHGPRSGR
jgi:drug/metabolite transporter (DMT)-like permease